MPMMNLVNAPLAVPSGCTDAELVRRCVPQQNMDQAGAMFGKAQVARVLVALDDCKDVFSHLAQYDGGLPGGCFIGIGSAHLCAAPRKM